MGTIRTTVGTLRKLLLEAAYEPATLERMMKWVGPGNYVRYSDVPGISSKDGTVNRAFSGILGLSGVWAWPAEEWAIQKGLKGKLDGCEEFKYVMLLRPTKPVLDSEVYSEADLHRDIEKLKSDPEVGEREIRIAGRAGPLSSIPTNILANAGAGSYHTRAGDLWSLLISLQTHHGANERVRLMNLLGYHGVADMAGDFLAPDADRHKMQAFFFDPTDVEVVEVLSAGADDDGDDSGDYCPKCGSGFDEGWDGESCGDCGYDSSIPA